MKIRYSFVSNSSTCSFVIGINYLKDGQLKKFNDWVQEEGPIPGLRVDKKYIVGEFDYHICDQVLYFLDSIGVKRDDILIYM